MREMRKMREKRKMREMRERREMCSSASSKLSASPSPANKLPEDRIMHIGASHPASPQRRHISGAEGMAQRASPVKQ